MSDDYQTSDEILELRATGEKAPASKLDEIIATLTPEEATEWRRLAEAILAEAIIEYTRTHKPAASLDVDLVLRQHFAKERADG